MHTKLPEIAAGYHFFADIVSGIGQFLVQLKVEVAPRETVKGSGFEVNEHFPAAGKACLGYSLLRQHTAGVEARSGNHADKTAVLGAFNKGHTAEQGRRSVVEHGDLPDPDTAADKLFSQLRAKRFALRSVYLHLLCKAQDAAVDILRHLGRIGKAEADVLRLLHKRHYAVGNVGDKLLPVGGLFRAGHTVLIHALEHGAVFAEAGKPRAEIRTSGVDHHRLTSLGKLSVCVQVCRYHRHGILMCFKPTLHCGKKCLCVLRHIHPLGVHAVSFHKLCNFYHIFT